MVENSQPWTACGTGRVPRLRVGNRAQRIWHHIHHHTMDAYHWMTYTLTRSQRRLIASPKYLQHYDQLTASLERYPIKLSPMQTFSNRATKLPGFDRTVVWVPPSQELRWDPQGMSLPTAASAGAGCGKRSWDRFHIGPVGIVDLVSILQ